MWIVYFEISYDLYAYGANTSILISSIRTFQRQYQLFGSIKIIFWGVYIGFFIHWTCQQLFEGAKKGLELDAIFQSIVTQPLWQILGIVGILSSVFTMLIIVSIFNWHIKAERQFVLEKRF